MRRASSAESLATQGHKVVPPKDPLLSVRKHFVAMSSGTTPRWISDEVQALRSAAQARKEHLIVDDNDGYSIPSAKGTRLYNKNATKTNGDANCNLHSLNGTMPMYAEYMPYRVSPKRVPKQVNWAADIVDSPSRPEYECGPYATATLIHTNDSDSLKQRELSRSTDARCNRPLPPLPLNASVHQSGNTSAKVSEETSASKTCLRTGVNGERSKRKSFTFKESLKPFFASLAACKSAGLSASCSTLSSDYGDAVRMREDYHKRDQLFARRAASKLNASAQVNQSHSSQTATATRVQKKARIKLPPSALKMPPFEQNVHIACETAIAADGTVQHLFASKRPEPSAAYPSLDGALLPPPPPPPQNAAMEAGLDALLGNMMNSLSLRNGALAWPGLKESACPKRKGSKSGPKASKHALANANGFLGLDEQWICYATFGPETTPKALTSGLRARAPAPSPASGLTPAPTSGATRPRVVTQTASDFRRHGCESGVTPTLPTPPTSFYATSNQHQAALMTINEDSDWCKSGAGLGRVGPKAYVNVNLGLSHGEQTASENDERHDRLDVSPATSVGNPQPSASPSTSSPSASTNSLRSDSEVKAVRQPGVFRAGVSVTHANNLSLNRRQVLLQRLKSSDKTDKV